MSRVSQLRSFGRPSRSTRQTEVYVCPWSAHHAPGRSTQGPGPVCRVSSMSKEGDLARSLVARWQMKRGSRRATMTKDEFCRPLRHIGRSGRGFSAMLTRQNVAPVRSGLCCRVERSPDGCTAIFAPRGMHCRSSGAFRSSWCSRPGAQSDRRRVFT